MPVPVYLRFLLISWILLPSEVVSWIIPQPKANVWVTLAKALHQEHMCLSMGSADDPLSSCLVGIPLREGEPPFSGQVPYPVDAWDKWMNTLATAPEEPHELVLLGSSQATHCLRFFFSMSKGTLSSVKYQKLSYNRDVTPREKVYSVNNWCRDEYLIPAESPIYPKALPMGKFLICGNPAWSGIPSWFRGGPCTLGRLSVLAPNKTQIMYWKNHTQLARQKRSIEQLDPNCDSEVVSWSLSKRIDASYFLPGLAAAKALGELTHLECWIRKHANLTSSALSQLLEDEETTRHATLQNRAAIDFLLSAHGHGCEEFEGLCCFNLSSHGESIHATIQKMKDQIKELKIEGESDWIENLFGQWGLGGWVASLLKTGLWVILIIFIVLSLFGCLKKCLIKQLGEAFPFQR